MLARVALVVVLFALPAFGHEIPVHVLSGFGAANAGLSASFSVPENSDEVFLTLRNQGKKPITLDVRRSCSGYFFWQIEARKSENRKAATYRNAVNAKPCRRNIVDKQVAIAPGRQIVLRLPFSDAKKLRASRSKSFRLRARLSSKSKTYSLNTGWAKR